MSYQRPTLAELRARITADLIAKLEEATGTTVIRRALAPIIAFVIAGAVHLLYGFVSYTKDQIFDDSCDELHLPRRASIVGVPQVSASYASGSITVTGLNGAVIPAGRRWQKAGGLEYTVTADATISGSTATVQLLASTAGAASNAEAGETFTLVEPIAGVNSSAVVASAGITGGSDVEGLEPWRGRVLDRRRNPPMGGADADYKKWALEVPGVTRAWVYPLWLGPGTVGVCFVRDNDGSGSAIIPDATEVAAVQAYIDARRPVTADVTVFAPTPDYIDHAIALTPNTAAVKAEVAAELADLYYREGEPGGTIYLTHIDEAISIAAGETNHILTAPTADYTAAPGHLPMLGTTSWA